MMNKFDDEVGSELHGHCHNSDIFREWPLLQLCESPQKSIKGHLLNERSSLQFRAAEWRPEGVAKAQ